MQRSRPRLAHIASAGVIVIGLGSHHSDEVVRDRILGAALALNVSSRGAALLQRFDTEWQVALETVKRHRQASKQPPRVMFILSHSGSQAMVAGPETAADAMIRYAGAINLLGDEDGRGGYRAYKPLIAESAVTY